MREILFRGKRKDNGTWIIGDIHKNADFSKAHIHPIGEKARSFDVIPETVGQYTGCLDKEGTKVFEGDIVWDNQEEELGVVEFDEGEFYVSFDGNVVSGFADVINCCCVQGNIHDDAKMLSLW